MVEDPNREQIEYWNGPRGEVWVAEQELRDRELAPFGEAALRAAATTAGETVLDIGCGCGATCLALAQAVGPRGMVLGVDVSQPMLARARARTAGLPQAHFERADAASFAFAPGFTLLFSRFGVMFFADPLAAFTNLRRALAPGGRLAFICWRGLDENDWLAVPFAAARQVAAPTRPPLPPDAPGPLAFANSDRVRAILEGAGFGEVACSRVDHPINLGNGRGLEAAATEALTLGPAARLLADATDAVRAKALAAVQQALAPHAKGSDFRLAGAAWLVQARAVESPAAHSAW